MVIRYLLMSTHYRKLLNFTFEGLEQAKQSLKRINDFIFTIKGLKPSAGETAEITGLIEQSELKFQEQMDSDFNISGALGALFDFIHETNLKQRELKTGDINNILDFTNRINSVLGVIKKEEEGVLDAEIEEKIKQRTQARKEKNFQLADDIRDELKAKGIVLIDTPDGTRWKYEK